MIIYKITNKLNGKVYIGQTVQKLNRRFAAHVRLKKSAISLAIQKYGKENFYVEKIASYSSLYELNKAEEYFINFYNSLAPNGYNLHTGGANHLVSEITRKKLSDSHKGKRPSDETRLKMSQAQKKITIIRNNKPNMGSFKKQPVICITNGKLYASMAEAARELKIQVSKICLICKKQRTHTKNLVFEYYHGQ